MDKLLDELLKDTQTSSSEFGESIEKNAKKRLGSNREAVRKYRDKKKAEVESLEDEIVKLRASNEQLLKTLQAQSSLETEATRLKCLLIDLRARIHGQIDSFPYQTSSLTQNVDDQPPT